MDFVKKIFFKYIPITFIISIFFVLFVYFFDLAAYDSSYINKPSITFSENNLNSKKSKKLFKLYEDLYLNITSKIFTKHKEYWKTEDYQERLNLPKFKTIPKKEDNFIIGQSLDEIEKNFSNWPRSHGGFSSSRFSSLKLINKNNINKLKHAWTYNSKDGEKGIQANPVVFDGKIYIPTPGNSIVCLDGSNGKVIWKRKIERGAHVAKRGLLIWENKKNNVSRLFFTNDDQLIALNAKTGELIKKFGENGIIKIGSSPTTPVIIDNSLIVGTFRPAIEAYDVETGTLKWKFYLRELEKNIFGKKDFRGGNPWGGISADLKRGLIFLTTGNPWPKNYGTLRPGNNLLANSVIAFDIREKKKLWHFQETCHDLWNFDISAPPILTTINKYDKRIDVVVVPTKLGNTLILDRYTGQPIFDYRKMLAPASKIPGEKTCKYQPFLELPEPFAKNIFTKDDITDLNISSTNYIKKIVENSNFGFFEPFELNKFTIYYNAGGGAQWTGASVDPYKNIMYVTANNIAVSLKLLPHKDSKFKLINPREEAFRDQEGYPGTKPPWGTITAINLNTGKIKWQVPLGHYEELKSKGLITGTENYGGATATAGGLVFAGGTLDKLFRAFDTDTGEELWSYKLPFIGSAPPTSYEINGEQYIIIPATGGITLKMNYFYNVTQGDAFVAFKIQQ